LDYKKTAVKNISPPVSDRSRKSIQSSGFYPVQVKEYGPVPEIGLYAVKGVFSNAFK
jgi:hypothetical protein